MYIPVPLLSCAPKAMTGRAEEKKMYIVGANILHFITKYFSKKQSEISLLFYYKGFENKIDKQKPEARRAATPPVLPIAAQSSIEIFCNPASGFVSSMIHS